MADETVAISGRSDVQEGTTVEYAPADVRAVAVAVIVEPVRTPGASSLTLSDTGEGAAGDRAHPVPQAAATAARISPNGRTHIRMPA